MEMYIDGEILLKVVRYAGEIKTRGKVKDPRARVHMALQFCESDLLVDAVRAEISHTPDNEDLISLFAGFEAEFHQKREAGDFDIDALNENRYYECMGIMFDRQIESWQRELSLKASQTDNPTERVALYAEMGEKLKSWETLKERAIT